MSSNPTTSGGVITIDDVATMAPTRETYKFVVLFFLYISQSIPAAFFIMAFPILLRQEGTSLNYIGLLNLLILPAIFKFLWAPLVDRAASYRSWIIPMQGLCVALMITLPFLDWVDDFAIVYSICMMYTVFSATQDIGVDGLAVRALSPSERPLGNGIQVAGQYIGSIVGGGALIVLYNKVGLGFNVGIITIVLIIPMVLLLFYREPPGARPQNRSMLRDMFGLFRRRGMTAWLLVLVGFNVGPFMSGNMVRPLLVDQGVPLETIGMLLGVMGPILGIAGCALAPLLINRLGRKRSLLVIGAIMSLHMVGYYGLTLGPISDVLLYGVFAFVGLTMSLQGVLIYAIAMDKSEYRTAGTDFTMQVSLYLVGMMLSGVASGFLAEAVGYGNLFLVSLGIQVLVLAAIARFVNVDDLGTEKPAEVLTS